MIEPEKLLGQDFAKTMIAGAAGGLVRWATLRNSWKEGAVALIVGSLCALYLGPIVDPLLAPIIGKIAPNGDPRGFASFFVGLGGVSLSGLMLDFIGLWFRWIKQGGRPGAN